MILTRRAESVSNLAGTKSKRLLFGLTFVAFCLFVAEFVSPLCPLWLIDRCQA
jgi:hypothetical protein